MRSREAFTLTELLLVIAILAVLNTLLIPVVLRWRETSDRERCKNNLKEIALASESWRATAKIGPFPVETWTTALSPHLSKDPNVLLCPKAPVPPKPPPAMTENGTTGQGTGGGSLLSAAELLATASASDDLNWMPMDVLHSRHQNCLSGATFSCNGQFGTGWYPGSKTATGWWQVDLGSARYVTGVAIWNWNDPAYPWGADRVTFHTSTDGKTLSSWSYSTRLAPAPFTDCYDQPVTIAFANHAPARYLRITIDSSLNDVAALGRVAIYEGSDTPPHTTGMPTTYAMNYYLSTVRRVSNTSGTVLALDYNSPIARMDSVLINGEFDYRLAARRYASPQGAAGRHPAPNIMNVAFVDGHVETVPTSQMNPSMISNDNYRTVGDLNWTNYGLER